MIGIVSAIGFTAVVLSTVNQLPQAIKVFRTNDTRSISLVSFCIIELTLILWLVYGIMLGDAPLIWANSLSLIPITYILTTKIVNVAKGKDQ